ncbi:MAG: endonuclease NucS [Rhodospirillaceae bacterium]|nr:endonuclease NucS [Rhodospirillaceae bacterium]
MANRTGRFENGIQLEELDEGLLVRQYDDAYVARRWRLTDNTRALVSAALAGGFRWMIRKGHPQAHARWPSGRGRVYLAFSPTREGQWSLAVDSVNDSGDDFGAAVFNGKYRRQFEQREIHYEFEKRNRTSGHLVIDRGRVLATLQSVAEFDHTVLSLGRSAQSGDCFGTEYDIQRAVLFNWSETPFGKRARIIGDEVPVDAGKNPRRVDILARNIVTDELIVIEIKRAEASLNAIDQLQSYIEGLQRRAEYGDTRLRGVLVAERIPPAVNDKARAAGITTYEIAYPFVFAKPRV